MYEGAFEAVTTGDAWSHDRIVLSKFEELMEEVGVVVIAKASMARLVAAMPAAKKHVPILSIPRFSVQRALK